MNNPYEPKRQVLHPEWFASFSRKNREERIRRYPETSQYGLAQEPKRDVVVQIRRTR
jgi:hypothetical protein